MIETNAQAMQAFGLGVASTAHNIANVNTNDFNRLNHTYSESSTKGVQVNISQSNPQWGPDRVNLSMAGMGAGASESANEMPESINAMPERINNNVSISREMTSLMVDSRAFEAQAVPIRTQDEMTQTLLDLKA